jgi:hypothetical protein
MERRPNDRRRRLRRAIRGQAMVEYSMLNWFLVVGLVVGFTIPAFPGRQNIMEVFLSAFQVYYDSIVYVIGLPFP